MRPEYLDTNGQLALMKIHAVWRTYISRQVTVKVNVMYKLRSQTLIIIIMK